MEIENLINVIIIVSIFVLVFSVWCICIFLWLGQYLIRIKSVQKRLGIVKKETEESQTMRLWKENKPDKRETPAGKMTFDEQMEALRIAAGWNSPAFLVIIRMVGMVLLSFVITYFFNGSLLVAFSIAVTLAILFWSLAKRSISKQGELFERQLVDALGISARALRAGLPLLGSFQLISEEIDQPVGDLFARICHEQLLGLDMKDSIRKVSRNVYNQEMRLFATSVAIQLQSGGNLADLMDSLGTIIRARMKLNRRARVLTSQTQLSKRVLIAIPILLFFALNLISPEYMEVLYTTRDGKILLAVTICVMLFGMWVMNRISVLRF